jgi:hypothetical protein
MVFLSSLDVGNKRDDEVMVGAKRCILILIVTNLILTVVFVHTQQNLEFQWKIPFIVALKVADAIISNLMGLVFKRFSFCVVAGSGASSFVNHFLSSSRTVGYCCRPT